MGSEKITKIRKRMERTTYTGRISGDPEERDRTRFYGEDTTTAKRQEPIIVSAAEVHSLVLTRNMTLEPGGPAFGNLFRLTRLRRNQISAYFSCRAPK